MQNWIVGASPENIGKLVLIKIVDRKEDGTLDDDSARKYVGILEAYYASPKQFGAQLKGVYNWQMVDHKLKYVEIHRLDK